MTKRRKTKKKEDLTPLIVIGTIIIILLLALVLTKTGYLNIKLGNYTFNPFGDIIIPELPDEPTEGDCTDFHIADKFRETYGDTNIDIAKNACNLNGIYREGYDISGCSFDTDTITADCNTPTMNSFKTYCKDHLSATWTCSNSKGFVGCTCDRTAPEMECWWVEVGEVSDTIVGFTYLEYGENLPEGKFKFMWDFGSSSTGTTGEIYKEGALQKQYINERTGTHIFESAQDENWGFGIDNNQALAIDYNVKLYQWVCEGYTANWGSSMFDSVHYQEHYGGGGVDCDSICVQLGYNNGGYFSGGVACNDYEYYDISSQCCCYVTQEYVTHGFAGGTDCLSNPATNLIDVRQSSTIYTENADYILTGGCIGWSPGGLEPAPGSTYTVIYT